MSPAIDHSNEREVYPEEGVTWSLDGRRLLVFAVRPHPVHRAYMNAIGAEIHEGWGMRWSKSSSAWRIQTYNRLLAPFLSPVNALQYINRYDYVIVHGASLSLGYWIKRFSEGTRLIYFNNDPFLVAVRRMPVWKQQYYMFLLRGVDGVLSGAYLLPDFQVGILERPTVTFTMYGGQEFRDVSQNPDAQDMIIISSLHSIKGVLYATQVFNRVRECLKKPIRLYIFGDGPQRRDLERLSARVEGIHCFGYQAKEVIRPYLERSLILLQLSELDSFAVVVLEAAAAGVLPVVTQTVGSAAVLPSCLVVPTNDLDATVQRVLDLYALPEERRIALREQLQVVVEAFSPEKKIPEFRQAVKSLVLQLETDPRRAAS